jgi:superfamily II DNA/RNA helicase
VCRDDKVGVQGGVHVIQTFFSKTLSEEVQIKGRTARQGDKGSYSMILLEKDLEYFMGAEKLDISNKSSFYVILNEKGNKKNIDEYLNNKKFVATAKEKHNASTAFLENMEKDDKKAIETFLKNENLGPAVTVNECRTLILMDATGSMSSLLEKAKTTVFQMFERTAGILKENKLNANCFSLQFAVYRNYNSKENEILEHSPWETKPTNLWAFMKKIDVDGGWGNEALEIGLFHANNEASTQFGISQIILIGDAPANSDDEIVFKKNDFGKKYWKKSKFDKAGNYVQEMHKLRDRGIKIHGYYVDQMAQTNFKEISECTGGNCAFLDVNDIANGAELLTKMVSEELLRNIGEQHGIGEKLVQCYRKAYK